MDNRQKHMRLRRPFFKMLPTLMQLADKSSKKKKKTADRKLHTNNWNICFKSNCGRWRSKQFMKIINSLLERLIEPIVSDPTRTRTRLCLLYTSIPNDLYISIPNRFI